MCCLRKIEKNHLSLDILRTLYCSMIYSHFESLMTNLWLWLHIRVTSHEHHDVSDQQQLDCLLSFWYEYMSHYSDVIMSPMASHITSLTIVNSTVYSVADQRKHQSSVSLAFVRGIYRWPVNSPRKGPVTRKMFPCDDFIMWQKVSKLRLSEMRVLKYYVENKALCETWK